VLDEVEKARIGPLEVLEDENGRALLGDPLEERPPRGEQRFLLLGSRISGGREAQESP